MNNHNSTKIGDTPLIRLNGNGFDKLQAYLKDEGANANGSIKDRRSKFIVEEAVRLGVDKLALITAGNSAYSLAKLITSDLKVMAIVDRSVSPEVKQKLSSCVYQMIEVNLQYKILRPEEVISFAREREDEVIWDVTNGYEESYIPIVAEIRHLRPTHIVVPVGSGGIYVGIVDGVQRYRLNTKVIGIGVQNTYKSFADKLHTPWSPYTKVMSKFHSLGHPIYRLTEPEIKTNWQKYQHVADLEPSSAVVFAALTKHQFNQNDVVIFINSGRLGKF